MSDQELQAVKNLSAHLAETIRLRELSDLDLIRECMKTEAADEPVVLVLMDRLRPGWLEEL